VLKVPLNHNQPPCSLFQKYLQFNGVTVPCVQKINALTAINPKDNIFIQRFMTLKFAATF